MVAPSVRQASATGSSAAPSCSSRAGPPTWTRWPPTVAETPTAGDDENSEAAGTSSPCCRAASTIALASGCSLSDSAAAASASTRSRSSPVAGSTAPTAGSPLVRVPVLSNSTVSTVRMLSSASRSFTSTPPRAARSVAIEMTSGIARPRAWGHAITSTVMVRITASSG